MFLLLHSHLDKFCVVYLQKERLANFQIFTEECEIMKSFFLDVVSVNHITDSFP